jgi:hypothetical protein
MMPTNCPICQGTGFANGKLCSCISGTPDLPGELKAIFGDIFSGKYRGESANDEENHGTKTSAK